MVNYILDITNTYALEPSTKSFIFSKDSIFLPASLFSCILDNDHFHKKAIGLIYKVYWAIKNSNRKYTASTKTKSEVKGSGKKPWRQKGTGRARAGSKRSPLWVGGGVTFGPKFRVVNKKINKKEYKSALLLALFVKCKHIHVVHDKYFGLTYKTHFDFNEPPLKTYDIVDLVRHFGIDSSKKCLLITIRYSPIVHKLLVLACRNVKNVKLTTPSTINIVDLIETDYVIITWEAMKEWNAKNIIDI